jgi:hypothetical protein
MKKSARKANVTPLTPPAKAVAALPPPLIAGMFAEAGVLLRPGRADTIAATLGNAVAKFREQSMRLPLEREPGLFPVMIAEAKKKAKRK